LEVSNYFVFIYLHINIIFCYSGDELDKLGRDSTNINCLSDYLRFLDTCGVKGTPFSNGISYKGKCH
jgi:hypothetical protein